MESLPPGALRAGPACGLPDRRPPSPSQSGGDTALQCAVPRSPSRDLLLCRINPTRPLLPKPRTPARPRQGGRTGSPSLPGAPSFPGGPGGPGGPCGPGTGRASGLRSAGPWRKRRGHGLGGLCCTLPSPRLGFTGGITGGITCTVAMTHSGCQRQQASHRLPVPRGAASAPRVWAQKERRGNGAAPGVYPGHPCVDKKH